MATNPEVISEAALEREPHRLVKAHKLTVAEGVALSVATSLKRIADMMEQSMPKREDVYRKPSGAALDDD